MSRQNRRRPSLFRGFMSYVREGSEREKENVRAEMKRGERGHPRN
jgi:hypothetical protein